MDDFVSDKLTEWGLSQLIDRFKDEEIDREGLYSLGEIEINEIIPKVGPRMKFKKNLEKLKQEDTSAAGSQVLPSTSNTSGTEKRRSDHQPEASELPPHKRQRNSATGTAQEDLILSEVNEIMTSVFKRLDAQDKTKLNAFLKDKINDLKTDKRKLVGVFGKTGAGKSSLINAVIGEKNLLPTGSVSACTTVMIKVEANTHDMYEANIEFITEEEWKDELWAHFELPGQTSDQKSDECEDIDQKLSALYGEESKPESLNEAMEKKHFKAIREFLNSERKILTFESPAELSAALVKFIGKDKTAGIKQYWPLVKCVTIKVPNNDFLKHVTLVDLPGNGDRNKSRNEMWKGLVGSCCTVWIVTEINRAEAEAEPWEILNSSVSLMGNGGECQHIHFICTKSDHVDNLDEIGKDEVRTVILQRNTQAKEAVGKVFRRQNKLKKHFSDDVLQVFTVSSKEFHKKNHLCKNDTEIPKLQEYLQNLNDHHSETYNYVYGAYGILSLMLGASHAEVSGKRADVYRDLEEKLMDELDKVQKPIEEACEAFETCLSEGVTTSEEKCEEIVGYFLNRKKDGRGFHRTLKSIVVNNGAYKRPKKTELNLNVKLCKHMIDSIDEQFKKTFPNEGKHGPFNDVIANFSLDTKSLADKYKDVGLQLTFLNTEEEKLKAKVISLIRKQKKTIYGCLPKAIEESMQECYQEAAQFTGTNTLKNMKDTIKSHVCSSKTIVFKHTKDVMMGKLNKLEESILKTLEGNLKTSMELSLKTNDDSIPDVQRAYDTVKKHYKDLSKQTRRK